jgi:eukaryotic-like serine/threonine-protein kinase
MASERWLQIERLYHLALEREAGSRAAFLAEACGSDEALRQEVESLLAAGDGADTFLETPAVQVEAKARARDEAQWNMAGKTVSHYRMIEQIGAGGMGVVYLARDETLDRQVALKFLPPGSLVEGSSRKRFHKEALALAKLSHPNIETIYEFDSQDGVDFLVTEYVAGVTLADRIANGPLTESELLDIAIQIASALEEAAANGLVHLDLKPRNMMLTQKGQVKLLDFGLARIVAPSEADRTQSLTAIVAAGTPPYMSPEQLLGGPLDVRTDIYALGACLYEMATGQTPFRAPTLPELIASILQSPAVSPSSIRPNLSPGLEKVILKCLEKDPEGRYRTAAALLADLALVKAGQSETVARPGRVWQSRMRRPMRRWRIGVLIVAVALVCLILLIVMPRPALSFAPHDWILLGDFINNSGEPVLESSLQTALAISLEQSAHVNVVSPSQVSGALKRMGKPDDTKITEDIGREICLRENVRGLLACSLSRVGPNYLISARLIDPHTGAAVRSYMERVESQDGLLAALGRVASKLRRELGESLASIQKSDRPLPQVTTTSLEALQYYADGEIAWKGGRYGEAKRHFENALRLDPGFAMAHAALGDAYASSIFNRPAEAKRELEKSLELTGRTTERERLAIEIEYAHDLGHVNEAANLYHVYLSRYPEDVSMRGNFAHLLMSNHQSAEAIEQYSQVLRTMPKDAGAWINLATSESGAGKFSAALRHYREAFKLEPTWITKANLNHEYGFLLVKSGNEAEARNVFNLALAKPDLKAKGLRSLAWLALYHGRYREAAAMLEEALVLDQADEYTLSEIREHLILALIAEGCADRSRAARELSVAARRIPEIDDKVWMGSELGSVYARIGDVSNATRLAAMIKPLVDSDSPDQNFFLHRLEAETALARGQTQEAIRLFEIADHERPADRSRYGLGRAYEAAGDTGQAIASYESLIGRPDQLGWEAQQDWLAAHYRLAVLYMSRNDALRAAPLLKRLLDLWRDADPDLPLLQEAKAEYRRINAR